MSPPVYELACPECGKSFGSPAHLKRHQLIHTRERTFDCHVCHKQFVRSDALTRHARTHESSQSLHSRGFRACYACAEAKAKCSAEIPSCARCQKRGIECVNPASFAQLSSPQPTRNDMQQSNALQYETLQPHVLDDIWASLGSTTNWLEDIGDAFHPEVQVPVLVDAAFPPQEQPYNVFPTPTLEGPSIDTPHSAESLQSRHTYGTGSVTSHNATIPPDATPGSQYVDGEAGRRAVKRRRKHRKEVEPTIVTVAWEPDVGGHVLSDSVYDSLLLQHNALCLQPSPNWQPLDYSLPAKEVLQHLLDLYFDDFGTLPFVHNTFNVSGADLSLILAIAGIGSHYLEPSQSNIALAEYLHEFTRRMLERDSQLSSSPNTTMQWQARLLYFVACRFWGAAGPQTALLLQRCTLLDIFRYSRVNSSPATTATNEHSRWTAWIQEESFRRLAYSAFFVDRLVSFHESLTPVIDLSSMNEPLPCHESLWLATSAEDWQNGCLYEGQPLQTSLQTALEHLYVEKRLQRNHGQFAQNLIVLGIMSRQDQVSRYYRNSLSSWTPKARRETAQDVVPASPVWLPSIPAWCAWENSFCDALDVVHWLCNAKTGESAGMEPPLSGFLHIARVISLTPLNAILAFSEHRSQPEMRIIQRWATGHQFKARLAMIHCGVTLWHYRRYSTSSFQEPSFVAYATLCLWAWILFAPRSVSLAPSVSEDSDEACDLILIDRPADDEIVQQFIRKGQNMQIHMTNVGDLLRDQAAPRKVLLQGLKIIRGLAGWDAGVWAGRLQRLADSYQSLD